MVVQSICSSSIAVYHSEADLSGKAEILAKKLALPLVRQEKPVKYDFLLVYTTEGLGLKQMGEKKTGPLIISFTNPTMTYRIKHGGGRRQALARALGLKKGLLHSVIDATAGLGRDAFILACLGCQVHMLERSPILAVLLEDALQRAAKSELTAETTMNRLLFSHQDSRDFLQNLKPDNFPDVIYLDPMYPERTKSSLVKKEMRILRGLVGNNQDAAELLNLALLRAQNRVVVKRPRLAPTLSTLKPSHQITGKTSRFDVYLM
jgi:16S rRNA (guanine1516-N2)-methyltransferase